MLTNEQQKYIARSVNKFMVEHDITQSQFADMCCVTKGAVSQWIKNNYSRLGNKTISRVLFVTTGKTEFPDELSHAHAVTLDAVKDEIVHKIVALPNVPREAIADIVKVIMEAGK